MSTPLPLRPSSPLHYSTILIMMTSSNRTIFRVTGLCVENKPMTGEFPSQRPVTRSFDVFFDLRLNKRLSRQSRRQWIETPWGSLWRHLNDHRTSGGITSHYSATWASWRLKLLVLLLFVQQFVRANNNENIKFPYFGLCEEIHWWPVDFMMTSSNGNILRVTGPLCGEFTGPRWIPRTKASDAELWCFLWSAPE